MENNIKASSWSDLFMAGTDASALTIEWALAELINNPHVMEKARRGIESVVALMSRIVEESDIVKLPYVQAILKEALRIHPTVPMLGRPSLKAATSKCFEWKVNGTVDMEEKPSMTLPRAYPLICPNLLPSQSCM
ncbi:hypothetical protein K1719_007080 [Acacia pycnantha]|nr:hypothetical protein K1719_007080 [Acacia pycnantha]